jgi:pimeloyl-ACP methyl ester carboxylesterase
VRLLLGALEDRAGPVGYAGQVSAASRHRAWRRLRAIRAPTLIQHGARDRIIRAAAARAMARRIPGAELEVYAGAGHALALQRPDSLAALTRFLRAHDDRLGRSGG